MPIDTRRGGRKLCRKNEIKHEKGDPHIYCDNPKYWIPKFQLLCIYVFASCVSSSAILLAMKLNVHFNFIFQL